MFYDFKSLKEFCGNIAKISDEAITEITNSGCISVSVINSGSTALLEARLTPNASLIKKNCSDKTIGLDFFKLFEILSSGEGGEIVEIDFDDLKVKILKLNTDAKLPTVDESSIRKKPKIPWLELNSGFLVDGNEWYFKLKQLKSNGNIFLQTDKNSVYIGNDDLKISLNVKAISGVEKSCYDVESLLTLKPFGQTRIKFKTHHPISIGWKFGNSEFNYLLAPWVNSD